MERYNGDVKFVQSVVQWGGIKDVKIVQFCPMGRYKDDENDTNCCLHQTGMLEGRAEPSLWCQGHFCWRWSNPGIGTASADWPPCPRSLGASPGWFLPDWRDGTRLSLQYTTAISSILVWLYGLVVEIWLWDQKLPSSSPGFTRSTLSPWERLFTCISLPTLGVKWVPSYRHWKILSEY